MSFQKLIQSSFLNRNKKEKKIKLHDGKTVSVKSGDILYVHMKDEELGVFKARFIDVEDNGDVLIYLMNTDYDFIDLKIEEGRIHKVERAN